MHKKTNNTFADTEEELHIIMPILLEYSYNLLKYGDNYSITPVTLWNY